MFCLFPKALVFKIIWRPGEDVNLQEGSDFLSQSNKLISSGGESGMVGPTGPGTERPIHRG